MSTREFSDWLNLKLEEKGWLQAELARRSGLSPATISRVINENRGVSIETCKAIANAFKIPPEIVLRVAGIMTDKPKDDPKLEEAMHLFQQIPEEDQQVLISLMHVIAERKEKYSTKN